MCLSAQVYSQVGGRTGHAVDAVFNGHGIGDNQTGVNAGMQADRQADERFIVLKAFVFDEDCILNNYGLMNCILREKVSRLADWT